MYHREIRYRSKLVVDNADTTSLVEELQWKSLKVDDSVWYDDRVDALMHLPTDGVLLAAVLWGNSWIGAHSVCLSVFRHFG